MTGRREEALPSAGISVGEPWGGIEATDLARMLPALPDSRGGTSRDATSSNRHSGCGGRRGSRQIRARRPRQERCGREGEQQLPPERSPRLRRPRGALAAAGAMLEEPECGAPGARGAAAGRFAPARRGRGGAASGLCRPRRRLGADGPSDSGPLLRAGRSVLGVVQSQEGLCDPNGALLDVIVAAATIFFLCFCVKFVLSRPSVVTGRCGQEGKQAQGDGGRFCMLCLCPLSKLDPAATLWPGRETEAQGHLGSRARTAASAGQSKAR